MTDSSMHGKKVNTFRYIKYRRFLKKKFGYYYGPSITEGGACLAKQVSCYFKVILIAPPLRKPSVRVWV